MNCCVFFIKSFIYFSFSSQEPHHACFTWFLSSSRLNLLLDTFLLFLHLQVRKSFSHWRVAPPSACRDCHIITGCHLQSSQAQLWSTICLPSAQMCCWRRQISRGAGVAGILDRQSWWLIALWMGLYDVCWDRAGIKLISLMSHPVLNSGAW